MCRICSPGSSGGCRSCPSEVLCWWCWAQGRIPAPHRLFPPQPAPLLCLHLQRCRVRAQVGENLWELREKLGCTSSIMVQTTTNIILIPITGIWTKESSYLWFALLLFLAVSLKPLTEICSSSVWSAVVRIFILSHIRNALPAGCLCFTKGSVACGHHSLSEAF